MASSAGKRRRVAPARLSEEAPEEQPELKATQENIKGEPKKRGRPATRKAQAGGGRGRTKKAKKATEEEEEAEPKEVEGEKGRMDQERAEGGPKEGGGEEEETKEAAGEEMKTKEGEEATQKEEQASRFLEKGLIYFFYRPKVGLEEVHSLEEVQRLYMLLIPKETMKKEDLEHRKHRMVLLTKKRLPDVHSHARYWGFVEETSEEMKAVRSELGEITYSTKTRGERKIEAARPAGRGFYGIIRHGNHTHLAYVLELPEEIGEVQEAFNITKEGSYIVTVKNPTVSAPMGLAPKEKEELPEDLLALFEDKRFAPLDPPSFLDYKGTEIIIIGASDDLRAELGKTGEQLEKLEEADVALGLTDKTVFEELHLDKAKYHAEPVVEGAWA